MPPAAFGKPLNEAQVAARGRWIEEGAQREAHCAFVAPTKPPLPAPGGLAEPSDSAIDRFVREALAREGFTLSLPTGN